MGIPARAPMLAFIAAMIASAVPAQAQAPAATRFVLPPSIEYPEGIAWDADARAFYVGSSPGGQLVRVDAASGRATPFGTGLGAQLGGKFPGLLGMHVDGRGRLWIAGGATGKVFVVDQKTGALVRTIATPDADQGLVNDIAFAGGRAFFTDTRRHMLWSVPMDGGGTTAQPWLDFTGTAMEAGPGANLNGIVATPDGRALIAGHMSRGQLFRIDLADRKVTRIDLGGQTVEGVDGLQLAGNMLYIVRQPAGEIVTVRLAADRASGRVVARNKTDGLAWPATAAIVGDELWVVNSQFNRRGTGDPVRPFWVQRIALSALGG